MTAPTAIVDTHVHLSNRSRWPPPAYNWHTEDEKINHDFTPAVFAAEKPAAVQKVLFVECMDCPDPALTREEAQWACELAEKGECGLAGVIAAAPLGEVTEAEAEAYLDSIKHPKLRGIRKLLQNRPPGFGPSDRYVAGVNACAARGLVVDICVKSHQLGDVLELVKKASPSVTFVLDHIGKPAIKPGLSVAEADRAWADNLGLLAQHANVACKISGVVTEVEGGKWTADVVDPFVAFVVTAFGWDRVMYGSDWYASKLASATYTEWLDTLKAIPVFATSSPEHQKKLFKENAERICGI